MTESTLSKLDEFIGVIRMVDNREYLIKECKKNITPELYKNIVDIELPQLQKQLESLKSEISQVFEKAKKYERLLRYFGMKDGEIHV